MGAQRRPRLGVFKMASCDGCQLTVLDCEDELLAIADAIDIVHFPEASSKQNPHGPFDLALVEGSISTPEQLREIQDIRSHTQTLVVIGACATSGGIQALRNFADHQEFIRAVYATPAYIDTLATSTPIGQHVSVDFELRGCPIDKTQLLEVISAYLVGRKPVIPNESVCMECKRQQTVCTMVARGQTCLGPVTHAGCGALCPRYNRGCYGCFGPRESANTQSLAHWELTHGRGKTDIVRAFRLINSASPAFHDESMRHDSPRVEDS